MASESYIFIQQVFLVAFVLLLPATLIYLYVAYSRFKSSEFKRLLGYVTITFSAMGVGFILNSVAVIDSSISNPGLLMSSLYIVAMMFSFISAIEAYKLGKIYGFSEKWKFRI